MTTLIDAEDAATLYEVEDGDRHGIWTRVAEQPLRTTRWMDHYYLVVTRGDGYYGIPYALGKTENQEHELPWEDHPDRPIELVSLIPVERTRIEYIRCAEGDPQ